MDSDQDPRGRTPGASASRTGSTRWRTLRSLPTPALLSPTRLRTAFQEQRAPSPRPTRNGFYVSVGGSARVLTPDGYIPIADLAGSSGFSLWGSKDGGAPPVEVWTGCAWAEARIYPAEHTHAKFQVETSNGLKLSAAADQTWAVLGRPSTGKPCLTSKTTTELQPGDELFPYQPPNYSTIDSDLPPPSSSEHERVRSQGCHFARAQKASNLPEWCHTLRRDYVVSFVQGWLRSQNGHLVGSPGAIQDLNLMLTRAGVAPCQATSINSSNSELYIPRKFRTLFSDDEARCFISTKPPVRVTSVVKRSKGQCYHLYLENSTRSGLRSVVINSVLILAPSTASEEDTQSSEGSDGPRCALADSFVSYAGPSSSPERALREKTGGMPVTPATPPVTPATPPVTPEGNPPTSQDGPLGELFAAMNGQDSTPNFTPLKPTPGVGEDNANTDKFASVVQAVLQATTTTPIPSTPVPSRNCSSPLVNHDHGVRHVTAV